MITRLKISRSSTGLLTQRYAGLQHQFTPNIILRNALMFSLNNRDEYIEGNTEVDQAGTEFQVSTLLGKDAEIYFMLLNEYYKKKLTENETIKRLAFHMEKGLKNENFKSIF